LDVAGQGLQRPVVREESIRQEAEGPVREVFGGVAAGLTGANGAVVLDVPGVPAGAGGRSDGVEDADGADDVPRTTGADGLGECRCGDSGKAAGNGGRRGSGRVK